MQTTRKRTLAARFRLEWQYHLLLIPGIIVTAIFCYYPLYGLVLAFEKYNPALGFASKWVGWKNFQFLFAQPNFTRTIWNSFYMSVMKIGLNIVVAVFFALLLNEVRNQKAKRLFQTLVYAPNFLSWVVVAGLMNDILSQNGIVNQALSLIGIGPIGFLSTPSVFPWTMIITDVWKGFGFGTVVYLAALTAIDPGLYEAACLDGATRWKQTIYITLPMLTPTIMLMLVLSLGSVMNAGFDQIYNMYSPIVYETGDIIDTYVYRLGIQQAQYSVGTAVGLFKSVISSILVIASYILADKVAGYRIF